MSAFKYSFHEERGEFNGYVEDELGNVIYEMHYPEYYEDETTGELIESSTIFEDGFMKDVEDTDGLKKYLVSMKLMDEDDTLEVEDGYEEGGEMDIEDEDSKENEIEEHLESISDETGIPVDVLKSYADEVGIEYEDLKDDLPYHGQYDSRTAFAESLVDDGVITDLSNYLYMTDTDKRILASEEADARMEGMDDEDVARAADKEDEYDDLKENLERLEELDDEIEELEDEIKDMRDEFDGEDATEEETEKFDEDIKEKEDELESLKEEKENLGMQVEYSSIDDFIDDIRDDALSNINDEITDELDKDAVGYFVDNLGYSESDLASHSLFSVDYEDLFDDIESDFVFIDGDDGNIYVFNNYAKGGKLSHGGETHDGNLEMLKNYSHEFEHHAKELQSALSKNPRVDGWVVALAATAVDNLSKVTHYLDGLNREHGEGHHDGEDVIKMDVPLFIRSQEYAREDAKSDADLHEFADNAIDLSQSGETLEMDDYNKLVPNHMAKGGVIASSSSKEGIQKLISEYYYGSKITLNKVGDAYEVSNAKGRVKGVKVVEKNGRYQFVNDTKMMARGGVNFGASFDKLKKEILDPNIYSPRDLKVGETYEWTIGAEPLKVKYLGLADENEDKKAGSSMGKGFLFEWVHDAGKYVELGRNSINQILRKITGYARGGRVLSDVDMFLEIHGYYPESVMVMRGDGMGKAIVRNEAHNFELSGKDSQKAEEMGYEFDYDKKGWVEVDEDDDDFARGGATFSRKVSAIAPTLEGQEVPKRLRKDYGKRYNKKEVLEAARRIAGSMRAKEIKKKKK